MYKPRITSIPAANGITLQINEWVYKSKNETYVSADDINEITVEQVFEESCSMIEKNM